MQVAALGAEKYTILDSALVPVSLALYVSPVRLTLSEEFNEVRLGEGQVEGQSQVEGEGQGQGQGQGQAG
mgnify:CR=1 FL=1